jgi:2-iminobutanoate/2-iminopropanoate deaminase
VARSCADACVDDASRRGGRILRDLLLPLSWQTAPFPASAYWWASDKESLATSIPPRMPAWSPIRLPADVPPPKGPYSPAVRAGNFIYVSGQVPRDHTTGELAGDDVATQTRKTLSNVQRVLEQAGASLADVISVTVYLARADDWGAMNEVYSKMFHPPYPSRTTVGAELRGILIEVSAVAYLPERS